MSETRASETGTVAESFRLLLVQNIGSYVVAELWYGGSYLQRRCGLLTSVGADYFLLEDEANGQQIAAGLSALRIITFCEQRPMPIETAQTEEEAAAQQEQRTLEQYSATQAKARPHSQAAFNYAKRKTRRLD